jgi:drug/metabolite transporter (DMT)-like permease
MQERSVREPASYGSARRATGYALVAAAASAWGTWPLFLRYAEARAGAPVPPEVESFFAMGVLTLTSAPFCLVDRVRARRSLAAWAGVAWLGFADAMNVVLFFRAYQTTSVAIAVLTHYLAPLFVAVASPFVLRERMTVRTGIAVAMSFGGLLFLLSPEAGAGSGRDWLGAALGAGSAAFYASNVLVNKRLVPFFSGSELAFFHGVVASPLLFALVPRGGWAGLGAAAAWILLAGALVAGALGGLFFVWGLRRVPATQASSLTFLEPLVAVLAAWWVLREPIGFGRAIGGVLILSGAALTVADYAGKAD